MLESHPLRKIYAKILGQTMRNAVFPLRPGEARAERRKWMENSLND